MLDELALAAERTALYVRMHRQLGTVARRRRPPQQRYPTLIESDYAKAIVAFIERSRAELGQLLAALPELLGRHAARQGQRQDEDETGKATSLLHRAGLTIGDGTVTEIEGMASRAAGQVSKHQKAELGRQTKAVLGVEAITLDPRVSPLIGGFVTQNVSLIKSLGARTLGDVEKAVIAGFTQGKRHEDVAKEIAGRYAIAERHARLIARDQIAKLTAQITDARHKELGIRSFVWRTMRDNKVRPTHRPREGVIYRYDQPGPRCGEEVCCRCQPEPVYDDILAALGEEPPARVAPPPPAPLIPPTFATGLKVDGAKLFDREPDVFFGVPTYRQTASRPARESVHVVRPSELVPHKLYGIDTGGDKPGDVRTGSIRRAWREGKQVPAVEIDVTRDGAYFIADGNHRVWAAIQEGDRPLAVRFRRVEGDFAGMNDVRDRMRKALADGKSTAP